MPRRADADKHHVTTLDLPLINHAVAEPKSRARSRSLAWRGVVAFFVVSALIGRVCYVTNPFDSDGAMFIYLGKLVADGGRYCHDIIDNKFPTVGLMTSAAWRAFGHNWLAYVMLQTAMAMGGSLLLARSAARHFGSHTWLPTALFAIVYLNMNLAVAGGFQLETMQAFFAILAAIAALEALHGGGWRDAFVVGLATGCAMMLKPTGGGVLAAFALATCFNKRPWREIAAHALAAAAGLAIPAGVVLAYLVQTDILGDLPALSRQIARYASETPLAVEDLIKPLAIIVLLGFPLLVRGIIYRRDAMPTKRSSASLIFIITWIVMELIGAIAQRRMYPYHFLIIAAPAALLYGMLPRSNRIGPIAAALLPVTLLSLLRSGVVIAGYYPAPETLAVSEYLRANAAPGDRVWQDNLPRVLLETDLQPGARIPLAFLFFNYDTAPLEYSQVILRDFDDRRPKFVILPADMQSMLRFETSRTPAERRPVRATNYRRAWQDIRAYVAQHYTPQAQIGDQEVFVRNGN
jgi:hypothetical protein